MNSKTEQHSSSDLLNIPSSEFVTQAYAKAAEINLSFPDVSAMLRAAAARIDTLKVLVSTAGSATVERFTPDCKMHMNHEMAYMRPNPNGTFVSLGDYLTLQKERNNLNTQVRALGAENSALRSGVGFFSYGTDSGFEEHTTADDAMKAADSDIDYYRGEACDGWSEETDRTVWGVIMQRAAVVGLRSVTEDDAVAPGIKEWCDYALLPPVGTSATDAILNEVRAQGCEMFVAFNRKLAKDYPHAMVAKALEVTELNGEQFASRIRAGEVQP